MNETKRWKRETAIKVGDKWLLVTRRQAIIHHYLHVNPDSTPVQVASLYGLPWPQSKQWIKNLKSATKHRKVGPVLCNQSKHCPIVPKIVIHHRRFVSKSLLPAEHLASVLAVARSSLGGWRVSSNRNRMVIFSGVAVSINVWETGKVQLWVRYGGDSEAFAEVVSAFVAAGIPPDSAASCAELLTPQSMHVVVDVGVPIPAFPTVKLTPPLNGVVGVRSDNSDRRKIEFDVECHDEESHVGTDSKARDDFA